MCSDETANYELIIEDCHLKVCMIDIANSIITAQNKVLEQARKAEYFFPKSEIRSFTVAMGLQSAFIDNVFSSNLPHKIVICMIDGDSYSGSTQRNPFHLKHNDVQQITVFVNGQSQPTPPMVMSFQDGQISNPLTALYDNTNTHIITNQNFAYGHALFAFDLCSDSEGTKEFTTRPLCLEQSGVIRIEMVFAKALAKSIQVLVYGESTGSFNVNLTRNVHKEL